MTRGERAPRKADDDSQRGVRLVSCPHCKGSSVFAQSNPYRPFCSAHCKGLDFGAWADESFRVPEGDDSQSLTESTDRLQ